MTPEQKDQFNQLLPKAEGLLQAVFSRRVDLAEAIKLVEAITLPPAYALPWFRALAKAAAQRHPELENWALRKARDLGCGDADFLTELQTSFSDLGDLAQADQLDLSLCRALLETRRFQDALAPLRRLCESQAASSGSEPFPLDAAQLAAVLDYARASRRTEDYLAIRKALRARFSHALTGSASGADYNLVAIDLDGNSASAIPHERKIESFSELISTPRPALRETLNGTVDLKFLFRISGSLVLVRGDKTVRLQASAGLFPLCAVAAHFVHAPFQSPPPEITGDVPGEAGLGKRELAARENHAIANLPALVPIMAEVFGLKGFANPEVVNSIGQITAGADKFFRTGVNSEPGYGRLVGIYCASNGLSNDFLSFLIRLYKPPYRLEACEGILGRFSPSDLEDIAKVLSRDGVYRFPRPIPADLLTDLIRHAETSACYPHPEAGLIKEPCMYPAANPKAVKYDLVERDLVPNPAVQRIMADASMLGVSQAYLGAKPILDAVAMWWSTTFSREASSEAAQLYHFDLERIKWLKWFIYLTDVDTDRGPHCFVRGSHRLGRKPAQLLQRGYQRISDSDMAGYFPKEDLLELTGPKGTIFVEDTSGFHKGKHPVAGPRLVIELEYVNSLYGAPLSREIPIHGKVYPPLLEMAGRFPQFLCKYAFR